MALLATQAPVAAPGTALVEAEGLTKRYGDVVALAGIGLRVPAGGITAVLGPNGAGKSTLLELICGLRRADAGRLRILGLDPHRQRRRLALRVGVQPQELGLQGTVTVREALTFFAGLHAAPLDVDALLADVELTDKAHARFPQLSGGQRRRLALARALVGDPELVVLDEPTAGLDPQGRDFLRGRIRRLRDEGRSVLLATHDMADAQALSDRVVILDHGRVVADGAVDALVDRHADRWCVRLRTPDPGALARAGARVALAGDDLLVFCSAPPPEAPELAGLPAGAEVLEFRATTLEDVFLVLTGRELRG